MLCYFDSFGAHVEWLAFSKSLTALSHSLSGKAACEQRMFRDVGQIGEQHRFSNTKDVTGRLTRAACSPQAHIDWVII